MATNITSNNISIESNVSELNENGNIAQDTEDSRNKIGHEINLVKISFTFYWLE
jgi:hypothetical protein